MLSPLQTMPYMPPELLAQSQLTPKADVYSFGIVMWELLSGQVRLPPTRLSPDQQLMCAALQMQRSSRTVSRTHGVAAVAQMPFANLTVGQVFFAVVHEKTRPPLDVLEKARRDLPEDEQVMLNKYAALMPSCWAEAPPDRPPFPQVVSELGTFRWAPLTCSACARDPLGSLEHFIVLHTKRMTDI